MIPAFLDVLTIFLFVAGLLLLWFNLREWRRRKVDAVYEADLGTPGSVFAENNQLGLPPEVTRGFVNAMNEYFAEQDPHIRETIAADQLDVLRHYQDPCHEPLRLSDVKGMFESMRDVTSND